MIVRSVHSLTATIITIFLDRGGFCLFSAQLIDLRAITIDGPTPEFSELFTTARLLWRDGG